MKPDAAAIAAQIKSPQTDHKTDGERALEAIESRLTTLQVGLEVLMGICSKVPDGPLGGDDVEDDAAVEELEVDVEGMEDEEEEELDADVLIAEGRDQEAIHAGSATSSPLPPVLEAFLTTLSLPSRLLSLATPTALSFLPLSSSTPPTSLPSPHPPTTAVLSTIHLRALETLNNLLISTSFFVPAPTSSAFKSVEWQTFFDRSPGLLQPAWDGLFALAATVVPSVEVQEVKGQEVRKELVDAIMSCLMGVSALTRGAVRLAPGQVEGLISAVGASERESFRTRVLGTLGALAMNDRAGQDAIQTNKVYSPSTQSSFPSFSRPLPGPFADLSSLNFYRRSAPTSSSCSSHPNRPSRQSRWSSSSMPSLTSMPMRRPSGTDLSSVREASFPRSRASFLKFGESYVLLFTVLPPC